MGRSLSVLMSREREPIIVPVALGYPWNARPACGLSGTRRRARPNEADAAESNAGTRAAPSIIMAGGDLLPLPFRVRLRTKGLHQQERPARGRKRPVLVPVKDDDRSSPRTPDVRNACTIAQRGVVG